MATAPATEVKSRYLLYFSSQQTSFDKAIVPFACAAPSAYRGILAIVRPAEMTVLALTT